jgi:hypothetical protein
MRSSIHEIYRYVYFDVIVKRMSEVRKGIFRNTNNDNNRHKLFNMVLDMNWDFGSLLNRSSVCDGIIYCNIFVFMQPF